jgi:hypothetical protein
MSGPQRGPLVQYVLGRSFLTTRPRRLVSAFRLLLACGEEAFPATTCADHFSRNAREKLSITGGM